MTTLFDHLRGEQGSLALPGPTGNTSLSLAHDAVTEAVKAGLRGTDLSDLEAQKFAVQVGTLVVKDEFLQEMSNVIGQPKQSESEDEFVSRCKKTMSSLLLKRLG